MNIYLFLARFVSIILHPVFIPVFLVFIMIAFHHSYFLQFSSHQMLWIVVLSTLWNLFMPLLLLLLLLKGKTVVFSNFLLSMERHIGLFVFGLFYFTAGFISLKLELHHLYVFMNLFASLLCFLFLLISLFIKISIHVSSWSVLISWIYVFMIKYSLNLSIWFIVIIFITGIVAWARRILFAHTHAELIAGYIVGISIPVLWMYLLE